MRDEPNVAEDDDAGVGRWTLPATWKWSRIKAIAAIVGGATPRNASDPANFDDNGIPWITPADLTGYRATFITRGARSLAKYALDNSSVRILPAGTVLFSSRAPIGYCAIAANEMSTNQGFRSFIPRKGISSTYLRHYLLGSTDYARSLASGTTFAELSGTAAGQLCVPIAPENEQHRIVAKIDELFSDIDEGERCLARAQALLKRYRQSVLKAAVTGELTRDWREKIKDKGEIGADLLRHILAAHRAAWEKAGQRKMYAEPGPPASYALPKISAGWVWASVDQIVGEFRNGLPLKPNETPPGIPILRISAVRPLSVDESDVRFYPEDTSEDIEQFWVCAGDLLFTRYNGSSHLVGICGRYVGDRPLLHPDKLMKARVADPLLVVPAYVELAANAGATRRFIESKVKTTAGQHGISGTDVKAAPVPIPPVTEQQRIVDLASEALELCRNAAELIDHETVRSGALRQSILRAAFSGKLVPQDPSDKPASVLLERIAGERAAVGAGSRPAAHGAKRAGRRPAATNS